MLQPELPGCESCREQLLVEKKSFRFVAEHVPFGQPDTKEGAYENGSALALLCFGDRLGRAPAHGSRGGG